MSEDKSRYLNLTAASSEQPVRSRAQKCLPCGSGRSCPLIIVFHPPWRCRCSAGHNPAWRNSGARRQRNYVDGKPEFKGKRAPEDATMADAGSNSSNITNALGLNETHPVMESATSFIIAAGFMLFICFFGIIGNSLVFWYLCFKIKRTKYTVYIINLAVADLIYLIFISVELCITILLFLRQKIAADTNTVMFSLDIILGLGTYADMFLLTAISVERCLATYHPMWYRYKRPNFQSLLVCVISWVLSILVTLVEHVGCPPKLYDTVGVQCTAVHSFLSVLMFLLIIPTMVTSSLIMLIMIKKSSRKKHPPKLIIVIVATVIVFLISVAPVRVLCLLLYLKVNPSGFSSGALIFAVYMCISINSSVNPFIYFVVGRQKIQGIWNFLEKALKKVFGEEEDKEEGEKGVTKLHKEGDITEHNIF
ncbi:proto-oncogene Mas-like [Lissotriton helveticus]